MITSFTVGFQRADRSGVDLGDGRQVLSVATIQRDCPRNTRMTRKQIEKRFAQMWGKVSRSVREFRFVVPTPTHSFGAFLCVSCRCCVLAARYLSAHLRARQ